MLEEPEGEAKVSALLAQTRRSDPNATLFAEAIVNQLGYERIMSGDTEGALELMQLNVTYPRRRTRTTVWRTRILRMARRTLR